MEVEFKEKFVERYSSLTDWETFKKISLTYLRRSIRVNTLKITTSDLIKRMPDWTFDPVPWCPEGFWITHKDGRRDIGNTIEHMLGYFYVQEAASMIPPVVLDPQPGDVVLDMCAAPGSKTSQIAQYMKNTGLLVANDYQYIRMQPLGINLQRLGVHNTVMTLQEGRYFKGSNISFDKILVDAPCSGTGTIRKSFKTLRIWNANTVRRIAAQQRQLITTAFSILKPGGTMVYSTCSLEPEEDEGMITYLLENHPDAIIEEIDLDIKRSTPVTSFEGVNYNAQVSKTLRIWPQDNDTEGFFVCKIRKE